MCRAGRDRLHFIQNRNLRSRWDGAFFWATWWLGGRGVIRKEKQPLLKTCLVLDTLHNKITIVTAILKIIIVNMYQVLGLPRWHSWERTHLKCRRRKRHGFDSQVAKISRRRAWPPIPEFLHGESPGQRSLAGHSPQSHKELDTTEATADAQVHQALKMYQARGKMFNAIKKKKFSPLHLGDKYSNYPH